MTILSVGPWPYLLAAAAVFAAVFAAAWRWIAAARRAEADPLDRFSGPSPYDINNGPVDVGSELRALRAVLERLDARVQAIERTLGVEDAV